MVEYIKAIVAINIVKFKQEVIDSSIVPVMDSAVHNSADNSLYIYFNTSLGAGEETTLDGLITAHDPAVDPGTVGDVNITPDDSGSVVIDGLSWPQADGTVNYVLQTDGAGQLSWVPNAGGGGSIDDLADVTITAAATGDLIRYNGSNWVDYPDSNFATSAQGTLADGALQDVIDDTSPQLGGGLDVNGQSIVSVSAGNINIIPDTTGSIVLDGLSWPQADGTVNYVLETNGAGQLSWVINAGGLGDLIDDASPQLGGALDINGYSIVSTAADNISITPNTTGSVILDGQKWPQADGAANQVIETNGAGQLAWTDLPSTSVYGSEYEYDESLTTSSTTSLTYVQKLRLTTASLVGGDYRLSWAGAMLTNDGAITGKYRIQIDNTNTIHEVEVHLKDHNEGNIEVGGFRTLTLAAGVHTIDLDYEAIILSKAVEIKKVVIDLLRVA